MSTETINPCQTSLDHSNKRRQIFSADEMLELWGLRISGGTLKSVGLRPASDGEPGLDEVLIIVRYVESTEGFHQARAALVWVYCKGYEAREFPLVGPGETLAMALLKRGWGMHLGRPRRAVAGCVVESFRRALEQRLRDDPMFLSLEIDRH